MNGIIDGSSLLNGTGMFNTLKTKKTKEYSEDAKLTGTTTKKSFKQEMDTVDISGEAREIPQAGYTKPAMRVNAKATEETKYKAIDKNGIQEGVELSDAAKNLLKELQDKYGEKMDIYVAEWNTDDEQDYYSSLSDKQFNALINPELLEKMASDEKVREKYESILASAGEESDKLKDELGEEISGNIKNFSVTIDADGNVSYMVQLLKDFNEKNKTIRANSLEELIERIRERHKAEAKKQEELEETEKSEEESSVE